MTNYDALAQLKAQQAQLPKADNTAGPAPTLPPLLTTRLEVVEQRLDYLERTLHNIANDLLDELRTLKGIVVG